MSVIWRVWVVFRWPVGRPVVGSVLLFPSPHMSHASHISFPGVSPPKFYMHFSSYPSTHMPQCLVSSEPTTGRPTGHLKTTQTRHITDIPQSAHTASKKKLLGMDRYGPKHVELTPEHQ